MAFNRACFGAALAMADPNKMRRDNNESKASNYPNYNDKVSKLRKYWNIPTMGHVPSLTSNFFSSPMNRDLNLTKLE